jgi:para-aminobenzoate synthetase
LGHQALAVAHGAKVRETASGPVHGRLSRVRASSDDPGLFAGCGPAADDEDEEEERPPFRAVRYHSLAVDAASLPEAGPLRAVAWADAGGDEAVALKGVDGIAAVKGVNGTNGGAAAGGGGGGEAEGGERDKQQQQPIIMALAHASQPHYGVQFHPESIATAYGARVLANFRDLALAAQGLPAGPPLPLDVAVGPPGGAAAAALAPRPWPPCPRCAAPPPEWLFPAERKAQCQRRPLRLVWERSPGLLPAAGGAAECLPLFEAVVGGDGSSDSNPAADAFWLDSATAPERARFSYMGGGRRLPGSRGPLWHRVVYRVGHQATGQEGALSLERPPPREGANAAAAPPPPPKCLWSYLRAATGPEVLNADDAREAARELPFNFWGGPVGYLGYELGRETLPRPRGGVVGGEEATAAFSSSPVPDAIMVFADRLLAVDHECGDVYALVLHADDGDDAPAAREARAWASAALAAAAEGVAAAAGGAAVAEPAAGSSSTPAPPPPPSFRLRHGRDQYVRNVSACLDALRQGESYELCLTTALEARWPSSPSSRVAAGPASGGAASVDPWLFYRVLRAINPAPYSAWLRFSEPLLPACGGGGAPTPLPAVGGLTVACSSPERFLRADRGGLLEARPIKGTARRVPGDPKRDAEAALALATSEKERSENLMIVDLLRNDLSSVCSPGTVHVPGLIELESYATVHQLVSTVRGLLRQDGEEEEEKEGEEEEGGRSGKGGCDSIDAVRAAFPGGSMTGAPKLRSCDILSGLEGRPRGVYSGAIGYVSVAPGAPFDLNIVIRTACFYSEQQQGGGGGGAAAGADAAGAPPPPPPATETVMSIGAGGAVVVQSDPVAEYDEMRLKASALVRAAAAAWLMQHGGKSGGGEGGEGGAPLRLPPADKVDALAATLVAGE